jgi:hypothetical protein
VIGGALMFVGGYVEHGILGWVGRQIKSPADEASLNEDFKKHFPADGVYALPPVPPDMEKLTAEQKTAYNEAYKKGPSALVVVAPTGQDMMGPMQLGGEFATCAVAALLAAIIVALMRPEVGFAGRWSAVFLIGIITWLSVNASYYLWYRYPWPWVQDELFCAMVEWAAAGIAIAAIVRPNPSNQTLAR